MGSPDALTTDSGQSSGHEWVIWDEGCSADFKATPWQWFFKPLGDLWCEIHVTLNTWYSHTASHTQLKKKHCKTTLILTSYKIHCIKLKKEKLLWLQIGFITHCWIAKHYARWTVVLAHWWFVQAHRSSCVAANLFPGERRRAVSFPLSVDGKFNQNEKSQGSSKLATSTLATCFLRVYRPGNES